MLLVIRGVKYFYFLMRFSSLHWLSSNELISRFALILLQNSSEILLRVLSSETHWVFLGQNALGRSSCCINWFFLFLISVYLDNGRPYSAISSWLLVIGGKLNHHAVSILFISVNLVTNGHSFAWFIIFVACLVLIRRPGSFSVFPSNRWGSQLDF